MLPAVVFEVELKFLRTLNFHLLEIFLHSHRGLGLGDVRTCRTFKTFRIFSGAVIRGIADVCGLLQKGLPAWRVLCAQLSHPEMAERLKVHCNITTSTHFRHGAYSAGTEWAFCTQRSNSGASSCSRKWAGSLSQLAHWDRQLPSFAARSPKPPPSVHLTNAAQPSDHATAKCRDAKQCNFRPKLLAQSSVCHVAVRTGSM